jgi:hypothetical protein
LALKRVGDGAIVASNINIQILNGTGTLHPFAEQILGLSYVEALTARPQVRYRLNPAPSYGVLVGAVEFELRFPRSALGTLPETSWPQAVPISDDQHLRFSTRYFQQGSDQVIRVIMVNPEGFTGGMSPVVGYRGRSWYSTLRFAIVWGDATRQTSYPPDTFSRSVITNAPKVFRVFDTTGADVSSNFTLVEG